MHGTEIVTTSPMKFALLILLCTSVRAEYVSRSSGFSVGPDGISIGSPVGGRDIAIRVEEGKVSASFSVFGNRATASQGNLPMGRIVQPPSALTDSNTFFRATNEAAPTPVSRRQIAQPR